MGQLVGGTLVGAILPAVTLWRESESLPGGCVAMRSAFRRAAPPAAVTAIVATSCLAIPEVLTMVLTLSVGFVFSLTVLVVFLRLAPIDRWPLARQKSLIWLVAAVSPVIPYTPLLLRC